MDIDIAALRSNTNLEGEQKIRSKSAQRQKRYRMRKKLERERLCPKKAPKTSAQRQREFRAKQKQMIEQSEDSKIAGRKYNAERSKRYREKLKIKKEHPELDYFPPWNESSNSGDQAAELHAASNLPKLSTTIASVQPSTSGQSRTNHVIINNEDPELLQAAQYEPFNDIYSQKTFIDKYVDGEPGEPDAYDTFALSLVKTIRTIEDIDDRVRLMNELQSTVDDYYDKAVASSLPQASTSLGVATQKASCIQSSSRMPKLQPGGLRAQPKLGSNIGGRSLLKQPAMPSKSNKPFQIEIQPTPREGVPVAQTQDKKKSKKLVQIKNMTDDGPASDLVEVPVEVAHPAEVGISTKASTTEVQTIRSRKKTNAQRCREYRERKKLQNTLVQNVPAARSDKCSENDHLQAKKPMTNAERKRKHYEAQKLKKQQSKKIPKSVKQKNKEYYERKKEIRALNTLNHQLDASFSKPRLRASDTARERPDTPGINSVKIEDDFESTPTSVSLPTATASTRSTGKEPMQGLAAASKNYPFIFDPIPIKMEVVDNMDDP